MKPMTGIFLSMFVCISIAFALDRTSKNQQETLDKAKGLINTEDKESQNKGFNMLKGLAESGNSEAQLGVGLMYYKGTGTSKNPSEAWKWYQRAADQGNSLALHLLAIRYRNGCNGIAKDAAKGEELLKKARSSASQEHLALIDSLEKTMAVGTACKVLESGSAEPTSTVASQSSSFKLRPYKDFVFTGWDKDNRAKCPSEHRNPKNKIVVFIDPKQYDLEIWCQCYLANIKQDTVEIDINNLDQKIDFYTDVCKKEAKKK